MISSRPTNAREFALLCPDPAERMRIAALAELVGAHCTAVASLDELTSSDVELIAASTEAAPLDLEQLAPYLALSRVSALVSVPLTSLDLAFALLGALPVRILADPTDPELLIELSQPRDKGVREGMREEVELQQIGEKLAEVARALALLAEQRIPPGEPLREPPGGMAPPAATGVQLSATAIRERIRRRRLRDQFFDTRLFADPAWDMLLDLIAARLEGRDVSVSSLCIASAVPPTTALRWIGVLSEAGLIERRADPEDARRVFIALSDAGADAMLRYFAAAGTEG